MTEAGVQRPDRKRISRHELRRWRRLAAARARMLPTCLIIGGQKCGTTSLHSYLVQHPDVGAPLGDRKELHYFDLHYDRSTLWYRGRFPYRGSARHTLDSTPYYLFHPAVPQRVHQLVPNAKLIVLLRDPVQRTYSHYHHSCAYGFETLEFAEAIAAEEQRLEGSVELLLSSRSARSNSHQNHSYVSRSLYAPQLRRWYEFFAPEQLLILRSEDLFADPGAVLARVQSWLGLPVQVPDTFEALNTRTYAPLDSDLGRALAERFANDRLELEALTGMTFDWDTPVAGEAPAAEPDAGSSGSPGSV